MDQNGNPMSPPQPGTEMQGQPQMMMPAAPVAAFINVAYVPDNQRDPRHHPGRLIYSATMDREKLKCLYCMMTVPFCCGTEDMARSTHYDVYSNGVLLSRPSFYPHAADCCYGRQPWGMTTYYSHTDFDEPTSASNLCGGNCFALIGYCGKYGEQINLHNRGCNNCRGSGMGHYLVQGQCCEMVYMTFGLAPGEGPRVSAIINDQVRIFRSNPAMYALDTVAVSAAPLQKMNPINH